jgi:hypothetical protein
VEHKSDKKRLTKPTHFATFYANVSGNRHLEIGVLIPKVAGKRVELVIGCLMYIKCKCTVISCLFPTTDLIQNTKYYETDSVNLPVFIVAMAVLQYCSRVSEYSSYPKSWPFFF